jgi:hypothetical protein
VSLCTHPQKTTPFIHKGCFPLALLAQSCSTFLCSSFCSAGREKSECRHMQSVKSTLAVCEVNRGHKLIAFQEHPFSVIHNSRPSLAFLSRLDPVSCDGTVYNWVVPPVFPTFLLFPYARRPWTSLIRLRYPKCRRYRPLWHRADTVP